MQQDGIKGWRHCGLYVSIPSNISNSTNLLTADTLNGLSTESCTGLTMTMTSSTKKPEHFCHTNTEACRASKIAVNECYSDWLRLLQLRDIKGCVTLGQVPMRGSSILLGPPGEKCDKCKLQLYGSLKNMPSKRWSCKEPLSPASKLALFLLTISRSSSPKHSRQIAHDTQ